MKDSKRGSHAYITDIRSSIAAIERYVENMSFEDFSADRKTVDAVLRNLEVIGEAVKRLPMDFRDKHPDISWRPAASMRDYLIHDYPDVDVEAVWQTIRDDLPPFRHGIENIQDFS